MDDNNMNPSDWLHEMMEKMKAEMGEGKKEVAPVEEEKDEKGDGVFQIDEEEVEMGERFYIQREYEESLEKYPPDHPKQMFSHDFTRTRYLPVTTISAKRTEEADFDEVVEEIKHHAYFENGRGGLKLNQGEFCRIWKHRFNYLYAGFILTPHGMIDAETFKSEILKVLYDMKTEPFNMDVLADHIYKTYIAAYKVDAYNEPNKIPFRNGDLVLNPDKKSFTFYEGCLSPVPYRFDYDFKNILNCEEPPFPYFKKWKEGLFDEEDQYSLKQMLGYLLIPSNEAQEAFFIIGKGGSGKSILTDCIIPRMLCDAAFPCFIGEFFDDKFQSSVSEGKLCIVDDDLGKSSLTGASSGKFKNFVSAKTIKIEHKHCNPVKINNSARIVCCGNHMIYSDDKTDGFTRRLHTIYTKPRTIEKVDRRFPDKIAKEIEMIVLWALEGLLEMFRNDGAPYRSERTETGLEYYAESQKWEEQFITDCFCYKERTVSYISDVKDALEEWLKDNAEVCGDGTLASKFKSVTKWLQDEGAEKNGFVYKRGIKRGDKYNARGYINMALREPVTSPTMFYDESGNLKIRLTKRKPEDQDKIE